MDLYRTFFQQLIDILREQDRFTQARVAQPQSWYAFTAGLGGRAQGVHYGFCFGQGARVRAEVYIATGDAVFNQALFEALHEDRVAIEAALGEPLSWEPLSKSVACRIAVYRSGSIDDEPEVLQQLQQWARERLLALKATFGERIARIVRTLPATKAS